MSIHFFSIRLVSLICLFALFGCGETQPKEDPLNLEVDNFDDASLPFDKRLRTFVERSLSIPATEKYSLDIFEEHLNGDSKKDMIITVNRLDYAIASFAATGKTSKASEIGFFGTHNYFFYYSTITNSFKGPYAIASTPQRKLKINFVHISSDNYKDFTVDYAIRNSQFRRVYITIDDMPNYAFQWKLYDGWGTDELESYCFDYGPGYNSNVKDIIITAGDMKNISPTDNYDEMEPQINCTSTLVKRFFFNDKDRKYYTPN